MSPLNSSSDFEDISFEKLEDILSKVTLKKLASKKLDTVSALAKNSFGITFCIEGFSFQLKLLIQQINFIENQISEVELQIDNILKKLDSPLTTIPRISSIAAATILGEIGDINRFSNASKLVAYAGLDASVSQSGEYECTNNHMSKRGSPYLRKLFFRSAFVASYYDPIFSAYYQKKCSEGNQTSNLIFQKNLLMQVFLWCLNIHFYSQFFLFSYWLLIVGLSYILQVHLLTYYL